MGNNNIQCSKSNDLFTTIDDENIVDLRKNYKIIDVDYLDLDLVHAKMYDRNVFVLPRKKDIVNNMLEYYLNHKDSEIYKKTEYLCNEKEKICICNTQADDFRKIYDGVYYKPDKKYISWFKL
jgi:hypothetical protein